MMICACAVEARMKRRPSQGGKRSGDFIEETFRAGYEPARPAGTGGLRPFASVGGIGSGCNRNIRGTAVVELRTWSADLQAGAQNFPDFPGNRIYYRAMRIIGG